VNKLTLVLEAGGVEKDTHVTIYIYESLYPIFEELVEDLRDRELWFIVMRAKL
jgi:hypothetical protein